ncbi:hypothetical protein EJ06DRAFT_555059 [Trichodelitschia bisporula]|uniref:CBF1-interacting co-repressor CIR N-terminal domain-containing protein n=1 Tax=Trichodelitschia bisporula TaxID=703511 RepID=A0A6G1I2J9_9PEZI|nr:hypothetical protein EJ06DRAFT_555059 [Trichodelitschia bisporula]
MPPLRPLGCLHRALPSAPRSAQNPVLRITTRASSSSSNTTSPSNTISPLLPPTNTPHPQYPHYPTASSPPPSEPAPEPKSFHPAFTGFVAGTMIALGVAYGTYHFSGVRNLALAAQGTGAALHKEAGSVFPAGRKEGEATGEDVRAALGWLRKVAGYYAAFMPQGERYLGQKWGELERGVQEGRVAGTEVVGRIRGCAEELGKEVGRGGVIGLYTGKECWGIVFRCVEELGTKVGLKTEGEKLQRPRKTLISKKSWNVWAPANLARVRRDEAAAAAAEAASDERQQARDAERRLALLRGEIPPPDRSPSSPVRIARESERREGGRDKKRRRLEGEDDTERDLRIAREEMQVVVGGDGGKKATTSTAPIVDGRGHINLFPVEGGVEGVGNEEAEREKKRREREFEDQYTMRLGNAAGREGVGRPWYADAGKGEVLEEEGKNVWGRSDPGRKVRAEARMGASDPLAFMKKAQTQLKQAEVDRRRWAVERERELERLRAEQERTERTERKEKKRRRREGSDDLEGFSLDAPPNKEEDRGRSKEHRHKHRRHRSRDRDRRREDHETERRRSTHHRERHRSMSPDREHRRHSRH